MTTRIFILLYLFNSFSLLIAQNPEKYQLVMEGILLHEEGDYKGAIKKYKAALKLDKKFAMTNYEIAYSYFALDKFRKSAKYAKNAIEFNGKSLAEAYILYGSSLDNLGKTKQSIQVYKEAIELFPRNHLLYYNLGLSYFNTKKFDKAESVIIQGITFEPSHAGSHLLLSYSMYEKNNKVKSLLPLYYFLLLEPSSSRARVAYEMLHLLLSFGIVHEGDSSAILNLNIEDDEDFAAIELLLGLLSVSSGKADDFNKSKYELFFERNNNFFRALGELNRGKNDFWWNFYIDFYFQLAISNNTEAYSYFISQSQSDEEILIWIMDNPEKLEKFANWLETHK